MQKFFLEIVVFTCGAVVMAFEIIGSRMLGPYVGTSIFVWTGIIGVILLSLSLGYYWGGRIADKKPFFKILSYIIATAAIFILLSTLMRDAIVSLLLELFYDVRIVSIIASLILFSMPAIFLGMVSPFAARLKLKNLSTTGSTIGNLYAISTIGSIAGTFLAGFYLIPAFKVSHILLLLAVTLFIFSIGLYLVYRKKEVDKI